MIKQISSKRLSLFSIGRHSISLGFFILVFGVCSAFGQTDGTTASDTASASAKVIEPISIYDINSSIRFGTIIPSRTTSGTVSITAKPAPYERTFQGGVTGYGGNIAPAVFRVTGQPEAQFMVTVTENVLLEGLLGSTMPVTIFAVASEPPDNGSTPSNTPTVVTMGDGGYVDLFVGGTLEVSANQAADDYDGDFQVTVTYQ